MTKSQGCFFVSLSGEVCFCREKGAQNDMVAALDLLNDLSYFYVWHALLVVMMMIMCRKVLLMNGLT